MEQMASTLSAGDFAPSSLLEEERLQARLSMVCELLRSRGIAVPANFADSLQAVLRFAELQDSAIIAEAMACASGSDLLARIRRMRRPSRATSLP